MERRHRAPSNFRESLLVIGGIVMILSLFVFSNVVTAIVSYERGYTEGKQYVISSIELQKCGILKKNFKKGRR